MPAADSILTAAIFLVKELQGRFHNQSPSFEVPSTSCLINYSISLLCPMPDARGRRVKLIFIFAFRVSRVLEQ